MAELVVDWNRDVLLHLPPPSLFKQVVILGASVRPVREVNHCLVVVVGLHQTSDGSSC